ncbi:NAD kinase [Pelagibacteraceae bacterium]|nr:NAD kinase [Pelagibacteraceae bacterium]
MKNLFYIFDRTSKSQKLKKILLKKNKNSNPKNCDYIIVCGGDGFMLNSLKRYFKFNKPFYGINCGTFGFLMNKYSYKEIEKKIKTSRRVQINPLEIIANSKKSSRKLIAINEVSLFRQSKQTASLSLKVANKNIIKKLISDGVIIATPAGSTAYNLSVHGPILSLNSGKLAVTPISPFRPRRWKGKIISNKSIIKIKNLDPSKRPVAAVADNIEVRNINSLSIKINTKIKINLLHDKNRTLVKKIQAEQLKKNT